MGATGLLVPPGPPMAKGDKKRNDKSAKIDAWVLFMVETIVNWRKQTNPDDEKLTVAEYLSEMVRKGATPEYEKAAKWMAQQSGEGPQKSRRKADE